MDQFKQTYAFKISLCDWEGRESFSGFYEFSSRVIPENTSGAELSQPRTLIGRLVWSSILGGAVKTFSRDFELHHAKIIP